MSGWNDDRLAFELNDDIRTTASTGKFSVSEGGTRRSWSVFLRFSPAIVDPRTINPANTNPANANPANASPVNTPAAQPATVPVDDDIVSFSAGTFGWVAAITSARDEIAFGPEGTSVVRAANVESGLLPLRFASASGVVAQDGSLISSVGVPIKPINAFSEPRYWVVGDAGRAYRLAATGGPWIQMNTGVSENLYGVITVDEKRGWIAGQNGLLLSTNDLGTTWQRHDTNAPDLRAVSFTQDGKTGYAAGKQGVVLRSDDSGATWTRLTNTGAAAFPIPLPAPWYILLNLLITVPALVLAAKGRPNEEAIEEKESIADQLVSDRALEAGDPDALNLRAIALGISRFLRNEKTMPPLTVAVTGEWGSGKSSLMNLLKADLADWGFRPVWFNAWHHQKEQHFLASLVQAIRRHASPPWWHVPFRLRLLWTRCKQRPLLVSAFVLAIAVLIGYERQHTDDHRIIEPLIAAVREGHFWDFLIALPDKLKDEFAFLVSVIGAIAALWKGLQSFAAKPAALLASVSAQPKLGDLDAEISFRGRFAPQFRDVTEALGERPLVLFVDDLDRCQPESVREMLEAINFLVTSGNCFVILGIDRARVERYLNLSFGKAAEEEKNFAANYLDKLINIEVPIPAPNDKEALSILTPAEEPEAQPNPWLDRLRAGMAAAWSLKPLLMLVALVWIGLSLGETIHPAKPEAPAVTVAAQVTPLPNVEASMAAFAPLRPAGLRTGDPGDAVPGVTRGFTFTGWPVFLIAVSIAGVAVWLFTRRPGLVVHDSDEFAAALEAWQPLLVARNRTPRSLKRFINRVRYLAMRQRPQEEDPTMWRALRAALTGKRIAAPLVPDFEPIPEPVLVALAAMTYASRDGHDHDEAMKLSQVRHVQKFGNLPIDAWKAHFNRISSDVRVN